MIRTEKPFVPFKKICAIIFVVWLLASICDSASAAPGSQKDPNSAEKIRRQMEEFQSKDLLRVTLHNNSEKLGCLEGTESDGILIVRPFINPHTGRGAKERVLYGEIAAVKREQPRRPNFLHRVVVPFATLAAVIFGTVKIGSNTPKTVALKVEVGGAAGMIAMQATAPRVPSCP